MPIQGGQGRTSFLARDLSRPETNALCLPVDVSLPSFSDATASAVLSDIGDAVLDLKHGSTDRLKAFIPHESNGAVRPIEETTSCYYLRLSVLDRPGVLAKVSAVLAKNKIGISSVIQPEGHEGSSVPLILMLHYAKNAAMQKALKEISKLSAVKAKPVMIRVENFA